MWCLTLRLGRDNLRPDISVYNSINVVTLATVPCVLQLSHLIDFRAMTVVLELSIFLCQETRCRVADSSYICHC